MVIKLTAVIMQTNTVHWPLSNVVLKFAGFLTIIALMIELVSELV